jgi:hypothetical protein
MESLKIEPWNSASCFLPSFLFIHMHKLVISVPISDTFIRHGIFESLTEGFVVEDTETWERYLLKKITKKTVSGQHQSSSLSPTFFRIRSPFLMQLCRVFEDDMFFYLILTFCEHGDLKRFVKERGSQLKIFSESVYPSTISHPPTDVILF